MSRHAHCQLTNSFGFRTNSVRTQKSALRPEDDTAAEYKSTSELLAARIAITSPDHGLTLASCMSSCRRPTLFTKLAADTSNRGLSWRRRGIADDINYTRRVTLVAEHIRV